MICDVCNTDNWIKGIKLAKCSNCGYVRAADKYFETDIKNIYTDDYYNKGDYFNYSLEESALKKNFENRLSIITKYLTKGKMLEIGSAYGYFLETANKFFEVSGVECNKSLVEHYKNSESLKNISMFFGPFEESKFPESHFDAIVALDTIEHIKSPKNFIEKCNKFLKKDGYIFIETGDINAVIPKIKKEKWRLVHPPEHLAYFSAKTLANLLEKYGFKVLNTKYVGFYRSVSQVLYRLYPNYYEKLPTKIKNRLTNSAFPTNTFDLMFVIAQKTTND